jgi:ornithine--oxo-acid transaminase
MVENSLKMGEIFMKGLKSLNRDYIRDIRGRGLFVGLEFNDEDKNTKFTAKNLCKILLKNKLLSKPTHENIIRFSPPLVINEEQINKALTIIHQSFSELDKM